MCAMTGWTWAGRTWRSCSSRSSRSICRSPACERPCATGGMWWLVFHHSPARHPNLLRSPMPTRNPRVGSLYGCVMDFYIGPVKLHHENDFEENIPHRVWSPGRRHRLWPGRLAVRCGCELLRSHVHREALHPRRGLAAASALAGEGGAASRARPCRLPWMPATATPSSSAPWAVVLATCSAIPDGVGGMAASCNEPDLGRIFTDPVVDCSFVMSALHQGMRGVLALVASVIRLSRFKEDPHDTLRACAWHPRSCVSLLLMDHVWGTGLSVTTRRWSSPQ